MSADTAQLADRIAWRRARASSALAFMFVATQAGSFREELPMNRPQTLHLVAWICWAVMLLVFLAFAGGLFRGAKVRALLNDETTLDHRRRAMAWGFWGAILAALAVYALSFVADITVREGARLVITTGIVVALMRFGTLEKKALKDG